MLWQWPLCKCYCFLSSLVTPVYAYSFDRKRSRRVSYYASTRASALTTPGTLEHALFRGRNLGPAFKSSLSRWQRELRAVLKPGVSEPPPVMRPSFISRAGWREWEDTPHPHILYVVPPRLFKTRYALKDVRICLRNITPPAIRIVVKTIRHVSFRILIVFRCFGSALIIRFKFKS